jgi:hypothetical protein
MNSLRPGLAALSLLWIASTPAVAALPYSIAPVIKANRMEAQQTCHHVRQTSRRHCTSTRLLQQAIRPPLHYPRRYYGTRHYYYPFAYYGYRPYYYPYYRPYWYRSPFWY